MSPRYDQNDCLTYSNMTLDSISLALDHRHAISRQNLPHPMDYMDPVDYMDPMDYMVTRFDLRRPRALS